MNYLRSPLPLPGHEADPLPVSTPKTLPAPSACQGLPRITVICIALMETPPPPTHTHTHTQTHTPFQDQIFYVAGHIWSFEGNLVMDPEVKRGLLINFTSYPCTKMLDYPNGAFSLVLHCGQFFPDTDLQNRVFLIDNTFRFPVCHSFVLGV